MDPMPNTNIMVEAFISESPQTTMVVGDKMKIKGKKAQVQITLTPESVEKARKLGLNISKIAQNALDEAIEALEQRKTKTMTNGGSVDARSASRPAKWWTGRD